MEVIANLQKTMEALNAKLDNDGSDTSVTTNSYRKRAKTGQSPRKPNKNQQDLSSDSESDQEMAKAANSNSPNRLLLDHPKASMDANAVDIYGGIQDDNITATMEQNDEEHQTHTTSASDPISHAADRDDDDL